MDVTTATADDIEVTASHDGSGVEVSVVVPVGRVDALLTGQLRAIMAQQTPFTFEVVLACNAAWHTARAELDRLVESIGDPRVRVVRADQRRSAAHARNVGAAAASADVLAFCDADDEVAPRWLANLVAPTAEDVAVGGHLDEQRFAVPGQAHWRPPATPGSLPTFLGAPYVVSANLALHRTAFESVGGFDVSLLRCEDIALSWDLLRADINLVFAPNAVVHYRHRAGVRELIRQHYRYGIGMSQVLARHPMPDVEGEGRAGGLRMLRPNNQRQERRSFVGTYVRRGSIAAGRAVGLATERLRRRTPDAEAPVRDEGGERASRATHRSDAVR